MSTHSLVNAAYDGDLEGVKLALSKGEGINSCDEGGATAVYLAAWKGYSAIVRHLLQNGADPTIVNNTGSTPLHEAASHNHLEAVRALLELAGSSLLDLRDRPGNYPLHGAVLNGHREMVTLLLEYGANPNLPQDRGLPLMHLAAVIDNGADVMKLLLDYGADPDATISGGKTALHAAAATGELETVKRLIEFKADINIKDDAGWTPLYSAADTNKADCVRYLIANGADPHARIDVGMTALHAAAYGGFPEVVKELLRHKPDLDDRANERKWTPLEFVLDCGKRSFASPGHGESAILLFQAMGLKASAKYGGKTLIEWFSGEPTALPPIRAALAKEVAQGIASAFDELAKVEPSTNQKPAAKRKGMTL